MAEAVVSFVVKRIGDLIIQESRPLSGVSDQVERAQTELQLMQRFLKDADARQRDNERVSFLVAKIRDAAYDLEDIIETFALKVVPKRKSGMKNVLKRWSCILVEGILLHKIGSEIGDITTKISDLRLSLQTYDIRDLRESGLVIYSQLHDRQHQLRQTYSHVIEPIVVGLEEDVHQLVMHLVEEGNRHRVVSIWGMGGSGKTTLAKQVYNHDEILQHFDCSAWVYVSQHYQVRDVLEGVYVKLISATEEERKEIAKMRDDEIPGMLSHIQSERKCLIVLDDIWKVETWDCLKAAFQYDERTKSRIILTTRNKAVAWHADINGLLHQPPPLNDSQSWELFEKIAMTRRHALDSEIYKKMKELGQKMLHHCAGLPLAITVLAGLLAKKNTVYEWATVYDNICVFISRGIGCEEEYAGASWVLALSYDDLPCYLKPCFLYVGQFPEDSEIAVKKLIKLWIAEGFISSTQQRQGLGGTVEDVAYNWFTELVERCLVQVGEKSATFGIYKACRMHDLLRDLCLMKADQENFYHIVNFTRRSDTIHPSSSVVANTTPMGKVRRIAIYLDESVDKLVPSKVERGDYLRSLLYFGPSDDCWFPRSKELISSMFKDLKLLRVLHLEGMNDGEVEVELPREIGNMIHLRFLSLYKSNIKTFPSFLGDLTCLQTLNFRVQNSTMTIPNVIWKMKQLRHLYLPWYYKASGKLQLSALRNLQTLYSVSSSSCDLNDLAGISNLRKLRIMLSSPFNNMENLLEAAGSTLNCIQSLFVYNEVESNGCPEQVTQIVAMCRQLYKLTLIGPTLELPKELQYTSLTKVLLSQCCLKDDQMAILEKLQNLTTLDLRGEVFGENTKILVFSKGGFPQLKFLYLFSMLQISECMVEKGAMPGLCGLSISNCSKLTAVPDGLRFLTTLREITIRAMPSSFCSKLKEGGHDFYKIQHVPSLILVNPRD